ncbi:hemolysin, partial [Clostridium saudiense]|nr:hemolysin [Clostridium saudiense]
DINKYLDLNLESEIIDTVGGLVLENLGVVPNDFIDKEITINSIIFKILSLDDKRIDKIQITLS